MNRKKVGKAGFCVSSVVLVPPCIPNPHFPFPPTATTHSGFSIAVGFRWVGLVPARFKAGNFD